MNDHDLTRIHVYSRIVLSISSVDVFKKKIGSDIQKSHLQHRHGILNTRISSASRSALQNLQQRLTGGCNAKRCSIRDISEEVHG